MLKDQRALTASLRQHAADLGLLGPPTLAHLKEDIFFLCLDLWGGSGHPPHRWLSVPLPYLEDRCPMELMGTREGAEHVRTLLRILSRDCTLSLLIPPSPPLPASLP